MIGTEIVPAPATASSSASPVVHATHGSGTAVAVGGLPMVLDPFAVATRAVMVLIGMVEPSQHIARAAIGAAIDNDSSAAIDVVIPRAVDLVLRRAAHLVSIGAGSSVVDHYNERLELWRRLACRSGLEPAAITLRLAPFPVETVAHMLRVDVGAVEECMERWYAGVDPQPPGELVGADAAPAAPAVADDVSGIASQPVYVEQEGPAPFQPAEHLIESSDPAVDPAIVLVPLSPEVSSAEPEAEYVVAQGREYFDPIATIASSVYEAMPQPVPQTVPYLGEEIDLTASESGHSAIRVVDLRPAKTETPARRGVLGRRQRR